MKKTSDVIDIHQNKKENAKSFANIMLGAGISVLGIGGLVSWKFPFKLF